VRTSLEGDGDRQSERGDHKAEVDPRPISLDGLGKDEKMDHHPKTHRVAALFCAASRSTSTVISGTVLSLIAVAFAKGCSARTKSS